MKTTGTNCYKWNSGLGEGEAEITRKVVKHWEKFPETWWKPPTLTAFKAQVDEPWERGLNRVCSERGVSLSEILPPLMTLSL